jgi:hypothetical protein
MLKHGLLPFILIFTIFHVAFGGSTEPKGLISCFKFSLNPLKISLMKETDTKTSREKS